MPVGSVDPRRWPTDRHDRVHDHAAAVPGRTAHHHPHRPQAPGPHPAACRWSSSANASRSRCRRRPAPTARAGTGSSSPTPSSAPPSASSTASSPRRTSRRARRPAALLPRRPATGPPCSSGSATARPGSAEHMRRGAGARHRRASRRRALPAGNQAGLWGSLLPAAWSYALAARARGPGHRLDDAAPGRARTRWPSCSGCPHGVHQGVLLPTAYYTGETFKPAKRQPARRRAAPRPLVTGQRRAGRRCPGPAPASCRRGRGRAGRRRGRGRGTAAAARRLPGRPGRGGGGRRGQSPRPAARLPQRSATAPPGRASRCARCSTSTCPRRGGCGGTCRRCATPPTTRTRVVAAGEVMLHAVDDVVAALAEGYQLARRALVRAQESARREFIDDLLAGTADVVGPAAPRRRLRARPVRPARRRHGRGRAPLRRRAAR